MNITYDLIEPPCPPMSWEEYQPRLCKEWGDLLGSGECDESVFQAFLEQHPSLLPSPYQAFGSGHHGPFPQALISQPRLAGLEERRPDFLWLARDSGTIYAVLIEIESPCKQWATTSGHAHSELTKAIDQLKEWQQWFANPLNAARFLDDYRIPDDYRTRIFEQRYLLIHGRRAELEGKKFSNKRVKLQAAGESYITWDRLAPDPNYDDVVTVVLDADGYKAIAVPPTIALRPLHAYEFSLIREKEAAVARSAWMPAARKSFLRERWEYWDNWARDNRSYTANMADLE